jgi:hypothetical protein
MLCGAMLISTVSVSAGEERVLESRPKIELSAGTWISVGDTRWAHNASSVPGFGNPSSKLTYKDVGSNVIDLTGKFWFSPRVFGRLNGGFADIGGGRLTDDDYATGQRLFSRTTSDIAGDNMYYINADVGVRVKEFENHRSYLDFFGGYQYWHTEYQAVGLGRVVCDAAVSPVPISCNDPLPAPGQTVITNRANWHSIRVGATTEYRFTRRLSLIGTAALIPLSIIENKDIHHLRTSGPGALLQDPSISMLGIGIGANADLGARFMLTKNIGLNVGYRVWWNHAVDGTVTFHGPSGSSEHPLTQFDSLRHGLTAGIHFRF